jgi:hypothetical protein
MPAAPAGQAGWPQHGQFEVLTNNPKYAAQGNKKRYINPDSRLKSKKKRRFISSLCCGIGFISF